MREALLTVRDLKKTFPAKTGLFGRATSAVRAVNGISFSLYKGETLGLVGESGCGKSTTGRLIMRLLEPTEGEIWFGDQNIRACNHEQLRTVRREFQMVFQDPYASLNPRLTVGEIIAEPMVVHKLYPGRERERRVHQLLEQVGLHSFHARRFPHEFSGGQRQRIGIARALSVNPKLIVADEPVSALDVSIQSQIVNLLQDLQTDLGLTYLFISHDLSVVEHISNRVGVMYLGRIVEIAEKDSLFAAPKHPYTQALLSAVPIPDPRVRREPIILEGDLPSPTNPPTGCHFHPRCPLAMERCKREAPSLAELAPGHHAACHLYDIMA